MNLATLDSTAIVHVAQWLVVAYFVAMHGGQMLLGLLSLGMLRAHLNASARGYGAGTAFGSEPPVSIILPAHNAHESITASVRALLQLNYAEFEVIVVDDGSRDGTLARLQREFSLVLFPEAYWRRLQVRHVYGVYRSPAHPRLRVIDKLHGGRADALNAGINAARYPLLCALTTESLLRPDSLRRAVQPFVDHPATVASFATTRVGNGCNVVDGFVEHIALPRRLIEVLQIVESLHTCVFSRLGWSRLNAGLATSTALGVVRKDAAIAAGGLCTGVETPELELLLRLHRINRLARAPYRIALVPEPVCWSRVPTTLRGVKIERGRAQRGLSDALMANARLLFHPRGGAMGWIAFPFLVLFEWLGPLLEALAYLGMVAGYAAGVLTTEVFLSFVVVAIGLGILVSINALLLEQAGFHPYRGFRQFALLLLATVLENIGYRQLVAFWRIWGLLGFARAPRRTPKAQPARPPAVTQPRNRPSGSSDP